MGETLASLGAALRAGDACTYHHSFRLIRYAEALGRMMDLSQEALDGLRWGVFLHDIGKLHVHPRVLNKPGPLSEAEWVEMRRHPLDGYRIVRSSGFASAITSIVLAHHEWYDGRGYPQGLKGRAIPLGARICSVVDMLDAITSFRPYHDPLSFEEACEDIAAERGSHFDPLIVDAFLSLSPAGWAGLQEQHPADPASGLLAAARSSQAVSATPGLSMGLF